MGAIKSSPPNSVDIVVQEVAAAVEQRWKKGNYKEDLFTTIAGDVLRESRLHERLSPAALIEWSLDVPQLPKQLALSNEFGDPPLTLYWNGRFLLDAYFWLKPSTAIHNHAFNGAFTVLSGESLVYTYRFNPLEALPDSTPIMFGNLQLAQAEMLYPGDVRLIYDGTRLIHAVWHLASPTVSFVLRSMPLGRESPRYYLEPGVSVNLQSERIETYINPLMAKRSALMRSLALWDAPTADKYAAQWLKTVDLFGAFMVLKSYFTAVPADERRETLVKIAKGLHGAPVDIMGKALKNASQLDAVPWDRIRNAEKRFLVALSGFGDEKAAMFRLIEKRYSRGIRRERIPRCIEAMKTAGVSGSFLKLLEERFIEKQR